MTPKKLKKDFLKLVVEKPHWRRVVLKNQTWWNRIRSWRLKQKNVKHNYLVTKITLNHIPLQFLIMWRRYLNDSWINFVLRKLRNNPAVRKYVVLLFKKYNRQSWMELLITTLHWGANVRFYIYRWFHLWLKIFKEFITHYIPKAYLVGVGLACVSYYIYTLVMTECVYMLDTIVWLIT
jgi:hypothetical protein